MEELQVLINAVDRGITKGIYNLEEAKTILVSIEKLGMKLKAEAEANQVGKQVPLAETEEA